VLIHALFIAFILEIPGQVFEEVQKFGCLGTLINKKKINKCLKNTKGCRKQ
jgi:hypothetical protein